MPTYAAIPVTLIAVVTILYFGAPVLVPVSFAVLLTQLLTPLVKRLERRLPQSVAAIMALLGICIIFVFFGEILALQIAELQGSAGNLESRANTVWKAITQMASQKYGLQPGRQLDLLRKWFEGSLATGGHFAVATLTSAISAAGTVVLVLILTFFMLLYRGHFMKQMSLLFEREDRRLAWQIMARVSTVGQSYVVGMASVILLVGVLDTVGFFILGIPYAVLFGLLGGLAVIIPYVGIAVIGIGCSVFSGLAEGSLTAGFGVLGVYSVVHFMEGNVISPMLLGEKVDLNPVMTILAVLIGGEIWGPAGMILFIPILGIVKVLLNNFPQAAPIAGMLGHVGRNGALSKNKETAAEKGIATLSKNESSKAVSAES